MSKLVKANKYTAVETSRAQFGFRTLAEGGFRVVVEPSRKERARLRAALPGWKPRIVKGFLVKDVGKKGLKKAMLAAINAVGTEGLVSCSPHSPKWLTAALQKSMYETQRRRMRMVAAVKAMKAPGCNLASRWSTKSLLRHLS